MIKKKKKKALEQPFKLCGTTVTCNKKYTLICCKARVFFICGTCVIVCCMNVYEERNI